MDSFELNKIAGAILFALLVTFGLSIFSEVIFETEAPETPGYVIAVATEAGDETEAAESQPIAVLLASADPAAGEATSRQCAACHTFGEGEANKVGPNLWDVVNRPIASVPGFQYSPAMQEFAAQAETWTFDHLNDFLHAPKEVVPGTLMNFAGLRNDGQRANVVAYLNTLSASPAPLPEPAAAEAAPAEGAAAGEAAAPSEGAEQPAEAAEAPAPAEGEAREGGEGEQQAQAAAPAEAEAQTEAQQAEGPAEPAAPAAGAKSAFSTLVAAADTSKGEGIARRCAACHSFEKDAGSRIGPNLWGVVDRPLAALPDFEYSPAMVAFSEGGARTWTHDELSNYLTNPREAVPGNKMIFPGLPKEEERANLIAYLSSLAE